MSWVVQELGRRMPVDPMAESELERTVRLASHAVRDIENGSAEPRADPALEDPVCPEPPEHAASASPPRAR
jgi:hypothetical protein